MRKAIVMAIAGGTAVAVAGGVAGYSVLEKDVTLAIDGQETQVSTLSPTVADVLEAQGITVGANDEVAPSLDSSLADGTRISVRYGREVTMNVDGVERTMWTTARSVDELLGSLGIKAEGAKMSTSRSSAIGREGLDFDLDTAKQVVMIVGGKQVTITTTGRTVGDALAAAKVTADADDKLSAKPADLLVNGMRITYVKVEVKPVTQNLPVPHQVQRVETGDLEKGTTRVRTAGVDGVKTLTFNDRYEDGKLISHTKTGEKVTKAPVTEVVLVGTKEPEPEPAPQPEPQRESRQSSGSSSSSSSSSSDDDDDDDNQSSGGGSAASTASGSVWDRLAQCESGGNWSINTGNGYYGGLQFSASTWRAYGGGQYAATANKASRNEQIAIAKKVQASQGWGAWPSCTSKLGIR